MAANALAQALFGIFKGNGRYHVAIVPNEWLSAYLTTLICVVFSSL